MKLVSPRTLFYILSLIVAGLVLAIGGGVTPSTAVAQATPTTVPGSQLPLASPAPNDVLFGIHGGTQGVGGTTSKFLYSNITGGISPNVLPTIAPSSVKKVVCFGDSFCSNNGNSAFALVTPQYCTSFNVQNNSPNPVGCFADQVAAYYGVPLLNLGQPGTCAASYGATYYCAGTANGLGRYVSQLLPNCTAGTLVLFEYAGVNEISQGDVGFQLAGGLTTFQNALNTMASACSNAGATVVMMDTPHQSFSPGTTLKLQQIQQASAAVQTVAANLGLRMARAYEVLGPCWYDALLSPGVNYCSNSDGLHPSSGFSSIYGAVTGSGTVQQVAVYSTPLGPLNPVGSTIVVDPGNAQQETVTITATASGGTVGGYISGVFLNNHASGAYIFSTSPITNAGATLLAQAFEQATVASTISNGANATVGTNQALPALTNYLINVNCLQIEGVGATPLGCSSPALVIQTTPTQGTIYFGGPGGLGTTYGTIGFSGASNLFAASGAFQAAGLTSTNAIVATTTSNYVPLQITTSSNTGIGFSMQTTGTSPQQTEQFASLAAGTLYTIACNVLCIFDATNPKYDLAINTAGDLSVQNRVIAHAGIYPNSATGANWQTGSGAPTGGNCTTSTAGSLWTRTDSASTLTTALYVCVNVSGTASWNAVAIP